MNEVQNTNKQSNYMPECFHRIYRWITHIIQKPQEPTKRSLPGSISLSLPDLPNFFTMGRDYDIELAIGAIENKDKKKLEELIEEGADIQGAPVLHAAVKNKYFDGFDVLLKRGFDVEAKDEEGNRVIHLLVEEKWEAGLRRFLQAQPVIDDVNQDGYTPLQLACKIHSQICVRLLLNAGASVDFTGNIGKTPAHIAIETKNMGIFEEILQHEPNLWIQDNNGRSAFDLAKKWSAAKKRL